MQDAVRYARDGIRINSICPGYLETPMQKEGGASFDWADELRRVPLGRLGKPNEIADVIVLMASPMSSFMVGDALPVDGALCAA